MDLNPDEVTIKQEMADACEQVYGIFDGTKWHRSALLAFVPSRSSPASSRTRAHRRTRWTAWRAAGVDVITVDPGPREPLPVRPRDLRRSGARRRRGELMSSIAAVDLGAQSGRVALGVFDGERLRVTEVHRFPNVPVAARGTLSWDILRIYGDVLDGLRAAARETGRVDSVAVDSWARRLRAARPAGASARRTLSTIATRRRARAADDVLARVPARELYERTGIQLHADQHRLRARRDGGGAGSRPRGRRDAAPHPRPGALLALRQHRRSEFTNATTTQCFDPRTGRLGDRSAASAWTSPPRCSRRSSTRAPGSARLSAEVAAGDGPRRGARSSPWRRTTPAPPSPPCPSGNEVARSSASARGRSSASRCQSP